MKCVVREDDNDAVIKPSSPEDRYNSPVTLKYDIREDENNTIIRPSSPEDRYNSPVTLKYDIREGENNTVIIATTKLDKQCTENNDNVHKTIFTLSKNI